MLLIPLGSGDQVPLIRVLFSAIHATKSGIHFYRILDGSKYILVFVFLINDILDSLYDIT
jgi:hypothetical protein